jgi:Family of unknown function (DUF6049)
VPVRRVSALGALLLLWFGAPTVDPIPAAAAPSSAPLSVTILNVTPRLPDATKLDQKITVSVRVTNTSSAPLSDVTLRLDRGDPLVREDLLQAAINGAPLNQATVFYTRTQPVAATLAAHASVTTVVHTEPGSDLGGLCLCQQGVYPVDAVVTADDPEGTFVKGSARTFMPSFPAARPQPVRVTWLWPLIDRAHRGVTPDAFTDDDLAQSVSPGGRLDRALTTVEGLPPSVRVSLVIDPELIDALSTMESGYKIVVGRTVVTGSGGPAARAWLDRLKRVAARNDVSLTGYADPDVDAIANAGLSWSPTLDPQVAARVTAVLGQVGSDVAWPVNEVLNDRGLDSVVGNGASLVLLRDTVLQRGAGQAHTPDALAPLPSFGGGARALVTSTPLQRSVKSALAPGAEAYHNPTLTVLLSQLAIRAAADSSQQHFVVLAPPRIVNTDPDLARQVIRATSQESWAQPITPNQAVRTFTAVDHGALKTIADSTRTTRNRMRAVSRVISNVDSFRDCLSNADAATLLGGYASAIQRAQSSAWRSHPASGRLYVARLAVRIDTLRAGVHLVQPRNAQYTLASSDAPLYVTVENTLPTPVHIRIKVTPGLGVQGFTTERIGVQTIPAANGKAASRKTVKVPAHVERSGRFQITVTLQTPSGDPLGRSVPLRVHSTALGAVALWITGSALIILVLAILMRIIRRLRSGPRRTPQTSLATTT